VGKNVNKASNVSFSIPSVHYRLTVVLFDATLKKFKPIIHKNIATVMILMTTVRFGIGNWIYRNVTSKGYPFTALHTSQIIRVQIKSSQFVKIFTSRCFLAASNY
jgi:hypothetical protein